MRAHVVNVGEELDYRLAEIRNHRAECWSSPKNVGYAKALMQFSWGLAMTVNEMPGAASTPPAAA